MSNVPPPPGGYPQQPQQPQYQPPPQPQPQYQQPPPQPQYQQPVYQQPQQFQPVNPAAAKSGNGCLKAFLIVAAICVILGVVGTIALFALGSKVVNDNLGEASSSDYKAEITSCEVDSTLGWAEAKGTLVNTSDRTRAFRLVVDFTAEDGSKIDTQDLGVTTPSLAVNEKGSWTAQSTKDSSKAGKIKCTVSKVYFFGT